MSKIIIHGFPLYSHTLSYVFYGFEKAAKHMGHEVFWFDNNSHPPHSDPIYKDAIFLTEGSVDGKLPIRSDGTYIVHSIHPDKVREKYLGKVKRFVDLRYNHVWHSDDVYSYTLDKTKTTKIGPCCYLEPDSDYYKLYMSWACDLLPHEFNFDDIYLPREDPPAIYFLGTISDQGRCENMSTIRPFIESCNKANVVFKHNCPWQRPLTFEQVRYFTQKSLLGVDLRGPELIRNGYVPSRV